MLAPTPHALAGSKRCVQGNILTCPRQASDGEAALHHTCIDPKLLCCHPCPASHSACSSLNSHPSDPKSFKTPSSHHHPFYNWSASTTDPHDNTQEARTQVLCDGCPEDDGCQPCAYTCPGEDACSSEDDCLDEVSCCDEDCGIALCSPCFVEECCTKVSCPSVPCVCAECCAACPRQDNSDPCQLRHHPSSAPDMSSCSSNMPCSNNNIFVFGSAQSNQHTHIAHIEHSFAPPQPQFHDHSSHNSNTIENDDMFSSGTSTDEFRSYFHSNGQMIQTQPFADEHTCLMDLSIEHCHFGPQSCCHGCTGVCTWCQEAAQNFRSMPRGSNRQLFGPLTKGGTPTSDLRQTLHQQTMPGFEYTEHSTASNMNHNLTERADSSMNSLSSWWLTGGHSWDGSMPRFMNSDVRSNVIQPENSHLTSGSLARQQDNIAALSYPSPMSKPGTSSRKTTISTSPSGARSSSARRSSLSADPSSDDDLKDQMRATSLMQRYTPMSKDIKTYVCKWKSTGIAQVCLNQFESAEALHNHIKTYHVDKLTGSCFCQWEGCDENHMKDFKQRSKLTRHLLVHAGYRPYKCGYKGCSKSFATNQAKDNHERTHAGDKPYQCKHCSYVTTTATQLKTHINAKHIKDKCFHCRICSFCCADSSNLSKHEKTHRARPYRCLHPGCAFKNDCRWENVKRHFKKSGHCPELLVDDSPEQLRYKAEAAEVAKRDQLPKKVRGVRRTGEVVKEEGESSA